MKIVFIDGKELVLTGEDAGVVKNILKGIELKKYIVINENYVLKYLINMDNVAYIKNN
jgi:hypothetical protein